MDQYTYCCSLSLLLMVSDRLQTRPGLDFILAAVRECKKWCKLAIALIC